MMGHEGGPRTWAGRAMQMGFGEIAPSSYDEWDRALVAIEKEAARKERKATVERIRAAATQVDIASHGELSMHDLASILDAEAARDA